MMDTQIIAINKRIALQEDYSQGDLRMDTTILATRRPHRQQADGFFTEALPMAMQYFVTSRAITRTKAVFSGEV